MGAVGSVRAGPRGAGGGPAAARGACAGAGRMPWPLGGSHGMPPEGRADTRNDAERSVVGSRYPLDFLLVERTSTPRVRALCASAFRVPFRARALLLFGRACVQRQWPRAGKK